MLYLDFLLDMALTLMSSSVSSHLKLTRSAVDPNAVHSLEFITRRRLCITYKVKKTRMECSQCGYIPMCLEMCYTKAHSKANVDQN